MTVRELTTQERVEMLEKSIGLGEIYTTLDEIPKWVAYEKLFPNTLVGYGMTAEEAIDHHLVNKMPYTI